jgi:hypothetical protein
MRCSYLCSHCKSRLPSLLGRVLPFPSEIAPLLFCRRQFIDPYNFDTVWRNVGGTVCVVELINFSSKSTVSALYVCCRLGIKPSSFYLFMVLYSLALGEACKYNSDCLSTYCVENVCCENACTYQCKQCPINVGQCSFVPSGTDPYLSFYSVDNGEVTSLVAEI